MSERSIIVEGSSPALASTPSIVSTRFELKLARSFIYKSVSEETRAAYQRAIRDFFQFVGNIHPSHVTPTDIIAYRDHLQIKEKRKANTVATKLAIVRSFFEYLKAGGVIQLNPASTKLVTPPELPTNPQGRVLTSKEVRYLLSGPDRARPEGARDYAMMLLMLRLSLRLAEVSQLRLSSIKWSHGRWILKCKIKGGKEETWPLPKDVKQAIDDYLKLDGPRRRTLHSDGDDASLFQPSTNYRTLEFDKPLYREVQMVAKRKDPKTIMKYDHARENLDSSPVNTLSYEED
jgi:site-specific recombinase XerD